MATQGTGVPLTWNEALSGIFGSISLVCWIFVLVPQVYENYITGSAAGLSLAFLIVWFLGDLTNFLGAISAGLLGTVIALAVWYLVADAALLGQAVYYNYIKNRGKSDAAVQNVSSSVNGAHPGPTECNETEPLLRRSSTDLPGSRRRSSALSKLRPSASALSDGDKQTSIRRSVFKNVGAVLALCIIGTAGWGIAYGVGAWTPTAPPAQSGELDDDDNIAAQVLGYASAVLYLGARIPQIVKNFRDQSCEGLSLLFFILSMTGNTTYGAQILFHSVDKRYVIKNLPWLIGSIGTIGEDLIIFFQFHLYRQESEQAHNE